MKLTNLYIKDQRKPTKRKGPCLVKDVHSAHVTVREHPTSAQNPHNSETENKEPDQIMGRGGQIQWGWGGHAVTPALKASLDCETVSVGCMSNTQL